MLHGGRTDVAVKRVRNWANGADMSPPLRCLMPLPATTPTKKGKQRHSVTVKGAELNNRRRRRLVQFQIPSAFDLARLILESPLVRERL